MTAPFLYRVAVRVARSLSPLLARSGTKLGRGVAGRRSAAQTLVAWGETIRDRSRPTVWFHAPSVGEGLQAQAVMEALRAHRPDVQVVFTHFSPSAEALARRFGADVATYLPWDVRSSVVRTLEAVRPDLLVFTKTEIWPVLTHAAADRGVPVALIAGSVPPGAGRRRWPVRAWLAPAWARLSAGFANTAADAEGLAWLGMRPERVRVAGDPGVDAAAERVRGADPVASWLAPFHADPRPTVVAGSTWPADEAVLLAALASVRAGVPRLRVVVAPHEPTPDRVGSLLGVFGAEGWHPVTLTHVEAGGAVDGDVIIVDRVGVLAELFTIGRVAHVGGGHHAAGLHSVLEPAAAGLPVVFGPAHGNARAATDLIDLGAARACADATTYASAMKSWLLDADAFNYAGRRASGYIDAHRGAAERTAAGLEELTRTDD